MKGERRADAGVQGAPESDVQPGGGDPYVVKHLVVKGTDQFHGQFYRVWSDGQIGVWGIHPGTCESEFGEVIAPPVKERVVVDAGFCQVDGWVQLTFSDGSVDVFDFNNDYPRCTISGDGPAPFCLGDIDRNGDTNFDDLLFVLRDWGACEG